MKALMGRQFAGRSKALEAHTAVVRLLSGMTSIVNSQGSLMGERHPANIAAERLRTVMKTLVNLQVTRCYEGF